MRPALALLVLTLGVVQAARASDLRREQRRQQAREHFRAGEEYLLTEHFEKAEREFKAAIVLHPEFSLAYYNLGQTYMALKRYYPDAVNAYLGCKKTIEDRKALDHRRWGEVERERQDQAREIEAVLHRWRGVRGSAPNDSIMRLEQQLRLLEQEKNKGAGLDLAIPAQLSLALGSAYFRAGSMQDAEKGYLAAIKEDRNMGEAHNNVAVVYMLTGRLDKAARSVAAAEKTGYLVSRQFKAELTQAQAEQ